MWLCVLQRATQSEPFVFVIQNPRLYVFLWWGVRAIEDGAKSCKPSTRKGLCHPFRGVTPTFSPFLLIFDSDLSHQRSTRMAPLMSSTSWQGQLAAFMYTESQMNMLKTARYRVDILASTLLLPHRIRSVRNETLLFNIDT